MKLKENDVLLCTVKRIEGTTVFLDLGDGTEGTMIFSEVSPGRIRNIREFVVPNKKIVCKILRLKDGHPQLSLRRVTAGERDEVLERYKKESILANMIKPVSKEKTPEIIEKIKEKYDLADFLDEARENPSIIESFVSKKEASELAKIFSEKREKEKTAKREVKVSTHSESGIKDIREVLDTSKAEITYLGSSRFLVETKAKDYKIANADLEKILEEIKIKAKAKNAKLEIKEK